jgi:hypothetical protein
LRHRETEFDVEEGSPSLWHWIIYPGGTLPEVIGETKFQSQDAAVAACVEEIDNRIKRSRNARKERPARQ